MSALCGSIVYDGAIGFLFIDNGNTYAIIINRSLVGISQSIFKPDFRIRLSISLNKYKL